MFAETFKLITMKLLSITVLTVLVYLSAWACGVWAIVEFIIYLVKDDPFNWLSLWCTIGSWIATIIFTVVIAFVETRSKSVSEFKINRNPNVKSAFQTRLDAMAKEAEERKSKNN